MRIGAIGMNHGRPVYASRKLKSQIIMMALLDLIIADFKAAYGINLGDDDDKKRKIANSGLGPTFGFYA